MTRHAREAVSLAVATAIGEVALLALMTTDWSSAGAQLMLFAFLVGPSLFLAVLAWRRRGHAERSRVLFFVAVAGAVGGLCVLGLDLYRFNTDPAFRRTPNMNHLLVPIVQWCAVGAVWGWLVVLEAGEKRATRQAAQPPKSPPSTNASQSP